MTPEWRKNGIRALIELGLVRPLPIEIVFDVILLSPTGLIKDSLDGQMSLCTFLFRMQ